MNSHCCNDELPVKLLKIVPIILLCVGAVSLGPIHYVGDVPTCSGAPPGPWHTYLCQCEASTWYGRRDIIIQGYSGENIPSAWATFQYDNWWSQPRIRSGNGSLEEHLEVYTWPELQFQVSDYTCYWTPLRPE